MYTRLCETATDGERWQEFVHSHAECTAYHQWQWKQVLESRFGFPSFYLLAEEGSRVRGILPLIWQKNVLSRGWICSLPFLSSGGIVAEGKDAKDRLLEEAISITRRVGAQYLELRYCREPNINLPQADDKIRVIVHLDADANKMWAALGKKVRNLVRGATRCGLTTQIGKSELLNDFYMVFAENMRDLGSPIYPKEFFAEILRAFSADTYICAVRHQGRAIAASFLIGFRDTIEVKWSASIRKHLKLKPNMLLWWTVLSFAGRAGYGVVDFGRSKIESGTHQFKLQWGGETVPLHWTYWFPNGDALPRNDRHSLKYRIPIVVWQRLPVAATRLLGPRIVKWFPS